MTVYVDDSQIKFGRMRMCHMIADSTGELLVMAERLGLRPEWIQKAGTAYEHFDVCMSKRSVAIGLGAV